MVVVHHEQDQTDHHDAAESRCGQRPFVDRVLKIEHGNADRGVDEDEEKLISLLLALQTARPTRAFKRLGALLDRLDTVARLRAFGARLERLDAPQQIFKAIRWLGVSVCCRSLKSAAAIWAEQYCQIDKNGQSA